jgi:hypothetical protein
VKPLIEDLVKTSFFRYFKVPGARVVPPVAVWLQMSVNRGFVAVHFVAWCVLLLLERLRSMLCTAAASPKQLHCR